MSAPNSKHGGGARRRARAGRFDLVLALTDCAVLGLASQGAPPLLTIAFVMATVALISGQGGYRRQLSLQTSRALPRVALTVAAAAAAMGTLHPTSPDNALLLRAVIPAALGMAAARAVLGAMLRLRRADGHATNTLVVGAGIVGHRIARHLLEHPEYGLRPVGFLDDAAPDGFGLPVLGRVSDTAEVVDRLDVTTVIVAFGVTGDAHLVTALRACDDRDLDVWAVPRFFEIGLTGGGYSEEIWGLPLVRMRRPVLRSAQWRLKRLFDGAVASVALVLLSPLFLAVAAAVKLTSPGPVFFRQGRVGQRGVTFDMLKFRSMLENDDECTTWSVTSDERVTGVGRLIRASSVDELPQLLNVIRGDMSLVGPRPERPYFVAEFSKQITRYTDRHRVPAGMTGLAQVNGLRGDTSIEERAVFDNHYIESWSLWNDIVILLRTVLAVVRPPLCVRVSRQAHAVPMGQPALLRDRLLDEPIVDAAEQCLAPLGVDLRVARLVRRAG